MRQFTAQLTTKKIPPIETEVQENWGCRKKWCSWFFFKWLLEGNLSIWQYCHTWVVTSPRFTSQLFCEILSQTTTKKPCIFRQNNLKAFKIFSLFRKYACCSSFCFKKCRKNSVMRGSFVKNEEARWWSTSDLDTKLLSLQICPYLRRKRGYRVFEGYFFIIKWFVNLISQYKTLHITFFFNKSSSIKYKISQKDWKKLRHQWDNCT